MLRRMPGSGGSPFAITVRRSGSIQAFFAARPRPNSILTIRSIPFARTGAVYPFLPGIIITANIIMTTLRTGVLRIGVIDLFFRFFFFVAPPGRGKVRGKIMKNIKKACLSLVNGFYCISNVCVVTACSS